MAQEAESGVKMTNILVAELQKGGKEKALRLHKKLRSFMPQHN